MEGFATVHGGHRVLAFIGLCTGIEERPEVTAPELLMGWAAPFIDHPWNLGRRDGTTVDGAYDQVVSSPIRDRAITISLNAPIESSEPVAEFADCPAGHVPEIPLCVAGVFAADLYLPTESEVVTGEDRGAGY